MNGIHDMGGMHGFGRVQVEADEPVFHEPWEGKTFALLLVATATGIASLDRARRAIESVEPFEYLRLGYYGRWLRAVEELVEEAGLRSSGPPRLAPPTAAGSFRAVDREPRFAVGEVVRAKNLNPSGHTRLPRYVRGRRGRIALVHPAAVLPDTQAHGLGENPEAVYCVAFEGSELWGPEGETGLRVHVDLFESYLEHASGED